MKNILFVTHGSKNIGMGHVMRCVSLANAFRNKGWQVSFFSKYALGREYIEKQQFDLLPVPVEKEKETCEFEYGSHMELEQEANVLTKLLAEQSMDIIFVDSYNVSNVYFGKLHQYTKCLVYLDDIAAFSYDVDAVLNYNFSAFSMGYEKLLHKSKLLLGVKYCPLREEFLQMKQRVTKKKVEDILITTGAADPKNMAGKLLMLCEKYLPQCRLHVVVGKAFLCKQELYELQDKNSNIVLYENPKKMSDIMLKCDVAVTAGGSTMYELAACGIPMVTFIYAENQRPAVEMLEQKEYVVNLGEYSSVESDFWDKSMELFENTQLRENLTFRLQKLVDGKGAERVVEELTAIIYGKVKGNIRK